MQQNTWIDHFIAFLFSARSTRLYRRELWVRVKARERHLKRQAFNQYLYRLGKRKVLKLSGQDVSVDRSNLKKIFSYRSLIRDKICGEKRQKVLVSFDIPSEKNKTRDWLRNQLKYWGFKMVHQSLWLGFGPFPKGFQERLKDLDIKNNVRVFKIVRG